MHAADLGLAVGQNLHDQPQAFLRDLHPQRLERLQRFSIHDLGDNGGAGDQHFKPFAAHLLDENGNLHRAARLQIEHARHVGVLDLDGDVGFHLAKQAVAELAGGDVFSLAAGERPVVDAELHLNGRRVDLGKGQGVGTLIGGDGVTDVNVLEAGETDDVPRHADRRLAGLNARELDHLRDLAAHAIPALGVDDVNGVAGHDLAGEDLADADAAHVVAPVDVRDQHPERVIGFGKRRRNVFEDGFEERGHVAALFAGLADHIAFAAAAIDDRGVELLLVGVQLKQQFKDLFIGAGRVGVLAVDLVDDDDDLQAMLQRLAQHKAGLRLGPIIGVDEQEHAVDHLEGTLDLAAEIGVTGSVDEVDGLALPVDGGVLGLDGDALLTLEIHGIHHAFLDLLVGAVNTAFLEEFVDEGGLPMVDVGDDGDVADVVVHIADGSCFRRNRKTCGAPSPNARPKGKRSPATGTSRVNSGIQRIAKLVSSLSDLAR